MDKLVQFGHWLLKFTDYRHFEHRAALKFLQGCDRVLDVACGRGTFIQRDPQRIEGMDINPDNIAACERAGLKAQLGDALNLDFPDHTFDGVHCSHLIQVFDYENALRLLREMSRIVKPGGTIVLTSFPAHRQLFDTPETRRAYPPHAIRSMIRSPASIYSAPSRAPTYHENLRISQEGIWLRRPALFEIDLPHSEFSDGCASMLNLIQHRLGLRKFWAYNGYVMKLRNGDPELAASQTLDRNEKNSHTVTH